MDFVLGLLFLTLMEIVLGIDNIVFITIVSSRLPREQQPLARRLGLILALVTRLLLLASLYYVVHYLQTPLFELSSLGIPEEVIRQISGTRTGTGLHGEALHALPAEVIAEKFKEANEVSWRDIVLFLGGAFLIAKSVWEIHDELGEEHLEAHASRKMFFGVLVQIALLDIIFSLDSVITAVGMVDSLWVMATAIVLAVFVMLVFAEPISRFVEDHPTLKMLALSFLILIGVMLVAESAGASLDKGYVYFAMFFALMVEMLNIRIRSRHKRETPEAQPV
jgi:predicted tellurium resistance membrane protein TerC